MTVAVTRVYCDKTYDCLHHEDEYFDNILLVYTITLNNNSLEEVWLHYIGNRQSSPILVTER